jgi:hypothetical protein
MSLEFTEITERFITHVTAIRTLTTMHALMPLQITSLTKRFMAQITGVWTLISTFLFTFSPSILIEREIQASITAEKN